MTDDEYIRRALELADGWERNGDWTYTPFNRYCINYDPSQGELDALAAQLVRQVDALPSIFFESDVDGDGFVLYPDTDGYGGKCIASGENSGDRSMNTIRAIVDSGVLTEQDKGE